MAGTRLEKVGTIFSRATGLMESGALKFEDRPLWYDVYKAFPPKEELTYAKPAPNMKLKKIFYADDKIRAIFHRNNKSLGSINLLNTRKTLSQRFIEIYKREAQSNSEMTEEEFYKKAVEILNSERHAEFAQQGIEDVKLNTANFKAAEQKENKSMGITLKDIFK